MVNYSIIIPHKNIPDLLQRCLNSIPRREDVQIIVIDDNSDAEMVDFSHFPGLNDPYIEIIFGKNENGRKGAGYARNLGLEHAKGKWLIFADADDYFTPCLEEALDLYKNDENDVIYFMVESVDCQTLEPTRIVTDERNNILIRIKKEKTKDLLFSIPVPWGRFIKADIVKKYNIKFQEVEHSNDVLFSTYLALKTDTVLISDVIIYVLSYRVNSLTRIINTNAIQTRIIVESAKYKLLKPYQKEGYAEKGIREYLHLLMSISKKEVIKVIPTLIANCGCWITFKMVTVKFYKSYL